MSIDNVSQAKMFFDKGAIGTIREIKTRLCICDL